MGAWIYFIPTDKTIGRRQRLSQQAVPAQLFKRSILGLWDVVVSQVVQRLRGDRATRQGTQFFDGIDGGYASRGLCVRRPEPRSQHVQQHSANVSKISWRASCLPISMPLEDAPGKCGRRRALMHEERREQLLEEAVVIYGKHETAHGWAVHCFSKVTRGGM